jgi:CheY-like chemotaxis protein
MLSETVTIVAVPNDESIVVSIDRAQIEQVLINLVINAQHAMPGGGQLTFQLDRVVVDHAYGIRHHEVQHGAYALLSVSDTGVGMDAATRARIFEPFFTTKSRGEGTGLGLAMAYGIVKQHGGHLTVYSEPGSGTIFKVYLPEVAGEVEDGEVPASLDSPRGDEHVIVVEDSADVRMLAERVLRDLGYRVVSAANASEARVAADACERLDLLLTDVVLPGQNGRQVYESLRKKFPELCVVYMSGYSENVISHHGMLDPGVSMVQKPFTLNRLAEAVRAELDKGKTRSS